MSDSNEDRNRIAEVIAAIATKVEYDLENRFGKYKYASADAVYDHSRKHIAEAGLAPWQDEIAFEIFDRGDNKQGVRATYELGFTENGERPDSVERRTQLGYFEGPQSVGALATYALKYWLRGKLLLATGEKDMDENVSEVDGDPNTSIAEANPLHIEFDGKTLKYHVSGGKGDRERMQAFYRALEVDFAPKDDRTEDENRRVAGIYEANRDLIKAMPVAAVRQINKSFGRTGITTVNLVELPSETTEAK